MKKQIRITVILNSITFLSFAIADIETPYPSGASDLVPNQHLEEFKLKGIEIEPVGWTWNAESVELIYEGDEPTLSQFKFADHVTVTELQIENQKLKQRVTELELRLSEIEKLLSSKE